MTRPPPLSRFATELPRAAMTVGRLARQWAQVGVGPRGDGRPVMVLPGLANSDRSNFVLRRHLRLLGYRVTGWGLGRNLGARAVGREAERLIDRIEAFAAEAGEPVTLVGISLGGILSRIVAHRRPDLVREVITISSPFAGPPTATNVWRAFQLLTGERITDAAVGARLAEAAAPLSMPATAIWSASDGFVNGTICRPEADGECRTVEIDSSHMGVQLRPDVLRIVAAILAGRDVPQRWGSSLAR